MEEAPVVVTAATGALGPVVAKLSTLLRRRHGEYQLRRGTRKDIKLIRSKLKSIHSILWVIWEREDLDAAGKELKMEAWRLADDMNDAIDDFILSLTKRRNNDGTRFIQAKIQPSPFQDLKRRADDVSERCRNKWKMHTAQTSTIPSLFSRTKATVDSAGPAKQHRVVDPYVHKHISELVGMEEPRDKLIEHLVGEEESTPQLKMACILGGAGMGKTTLARLVYEAIEDKFQARAFVSTTSSRNMTEVLASILQQVTADSTRAAATKNKHLVDIISSFLKDKRYLVIIDDIWHSTEWETVKESLPENYLGSRIVTTSRVNAITEKWRDNFDALVYEIDYFDYLDGQGFSDKMIDMNVDVVGEGFDRDHPIVKMCRGMPLALTCMFSALAKEREHQEQQRLWLCRGTRDLQDRIEEQVTKNGIQNTPGFEPLVESLELGYNHLPHHMMKTCLLYCSIYPEGHLFDRDDMVRRWMAQGFVCKQEVAKGYFDELASRGWFYSAEDGSRFYPMMQSYLRCKLREDNFITFSSDIPCSQVGRLCIECWPASSDAVDTLSGINYWHHIRFLVIFKDAERVPYKHLENLRVLDVQCNPAIENQHLKDMCGLRRLRHLFVSVGLDGDGKVITEIPAEIARLQYLETLEVCRTGITRLPAEIGDLKQLKTLVVNTEFTVLKSLQVVSFNSKLAELPREMGNLQDVLETLCIRRSNLREQTWEIIGKLKKLKTLDVSGSHHLSRIPRDIGELQHLETLDVSCTRITEVPKEIGKLQHLKTLNLCSTLITQLPREIGNLQRLQILDLGYSTEFTKLPRDIGKLQDLETLNLNRTNVKKIPREIGGLKNLKNLDGAFGRLPFEAAQLSKLERLPKCARRAWNNSDVVSLLAREILSFSETDELGGDGGLIVGTKHIHIPPWIKEHFNNIYSLDIRICKLEEQDLNILREMPYLCELTLRFEAVPRKPVAISGGGFAKLLELTVDSRVPRITFQEGAMPSLQRLRFEFQFYGGPPDTHHPIGIKHLVSLDYVSFVRNDWYRTDSPCISATIDALVRKEAREHPNRISCRIIVRSQNTVSSQWLDIAESSEVSSEACSSGAGGIEEVEA